MPRRTVRFRLALHELFMRHAPWLAARLRAALPPPDVEDVLQETFLLAALRAGQITLAQIP